MMTKIDNIVEELKSLTLIEATELVKKIESVFSVDTAAISMSSFTNTTGPSAINAQDTEEQTEFAVVLEEVPSAKKIAILKEVRSLTGLGLKDAKNLVESYPKVLKENVSKGDASTIKQKLEDVGAKVIIK